MPATPEQVYDVVTDPARVGEWSHEAVSGHWLDGATEARVGARFSGTSTLRGISWTRTLEVDVAEPGRAFGFHNVGSNHASQWRFDLTPSDGGTLIRQAFRIIFMSRARELFLRTLFPSHADRSDALNGDLVRLGEVAARGVREQVR